MSNKSLRKTVTSDRAPEEEKKKKKKRKDLAGGVGRSVVGQIPVVGPYLSAGNALFEGITGEPGPFGSGAGIASGNFGEIVFDPDGIGKALGFNIFAQEGGQIKKKTKKKKRVVRGVGAAKRGYGKATYSNKMY